VFGTERLLGRRCGNSQCDLVSDVDRQERLTTGPEVLVIALNRFELVQRSGGQLSYRKSNKKMPFGRELDLTPYFEIPTTHKYRLASVIRHSGSLNSGHYKIIAQDPIGRWKWFDDEYVERATLAAALSDTNSFNPLTLFYTRIEDPGQVERAPVAATIAAPANTNSVKKTTKPRQGDKAKKRTSNKNKKQTR